MLKVVFERPNGRQDRRIKLTRDLPNRFAQLAGGRAAWLARTVLAFLNADAGSPAPHLLV
jgi:hypothetical protein